MRNRNELLEENKKLAKERDGYMVEVNDMLQRLKSGNISEVEVFDRLTFINNRMTDMIKEMKALALETIQLNESERNFDTIV